MGDEFTWLLGDYKLHEWQVKGLAQVLGRIYRELMRESEGIIKQYLQRGLGGEETGSKQCTA